MGWAVLDKQEGHHAHLPDSGIERFPRRQVPDKKGELVREDFQVYKSRLIDHWVDHFEWMIRGFQPDEVVAEMQPAVGQGNYVAATQSELAKTAITVCRVIAMQQGYPWREIMPSSWHVSLVGKQPKGKKITKVMVRNEVLSVFPELVPRKKELTDSADEADAIGIGLVGLGYKHGTASPVSPCHS